MKLKDGFYWIKYRLKSAKEVEEIEIVEISGEWYDVIGSDMPYELDDIEILKALRIKKPSWRIEKKKQSHKENHVGKPNDILDDFRSGIDER